MTTGDAHGRTSLPLLLELSESLSTAATAAETASYSTPSTELPLSSPPLAGASDTQSSSSASQAEAAVAGVVGEGVAFSLEKYVGKSTASSLASAATSSGCVGEGVVALLRAEEPRNPRSRGPPEEEESLSSPTPAPSSFPLPSAKDPLASSPTSTSRAPLAEYESPASTSRSPLDENESPASTSFSPLDERESIPTSMSSLELAEPESLPTWMSSLALDNESALLESPASGSAESRLPEDEDSHSAGISTESDPYEPDEEPTQRPHYVNTSAVHATIHHDGCDVPLVLLSLYELALESSDEDAAAAAPNSQHHKSSD